MQKVNFVKKSGTSHWEISISCTTQESDNVTDSTLLSDFNFKICQVITLEG